jgi:hypothetical protein
VSPAKRGLPLTSGRLGGAILRGLRRLVSIRRSESEWHGADDGRSVGILYRSGVARIGLVRNILDNQCRIVVARVLLTLVCAPYDDLRLVQNHR